MGLLVLRLSGLVLNAYVTHVSGTGHGQWDQQAQRCGREETSLVSSAAWGVGGGRGMGLEGSSAQGSPISCPAPCRVTDAKPDSDGLLFNLTFPPL